MTNIIVVRAKGARGPKGDPGNLDNLISAVSFTYEKQTNSNSWVVNHNLGFRPNVIVIDYGQNNVECDIAHTNENSLTLTFSEAISGYAYLS
jgi:hypothetical protein